MRRICSRASPAGLSAFAACAMRSSTRVPLTSSAPKCSAIDAVSSPDHHPVRLDVREVVEEQPGGGDHAQVVGRRRLARHQLRVADLVGEGDEGQEAAGLVLLLAQAQHVLDPLRVGLDVAVEHRGVGLDAEAVRDPVDLAPAVGVGLAGEAERLLEAGGEDLGAAARHGVEPGRLQARQRLARLDLPAPPEVVDLGRGERLDLGLRPGRVNRLRSVARSTRTASPDGGRRRCGPRGRPALIMPTMSSIECSNAPASPFFRAKSQNEQERTQMLVGLM